MRLKYKQRQAGRDMMREQVAGRKNEKRKKEKKDGRGGVRSLLRSTNGEYYIRHYGGMHTFF